MVWLAGEIWILLMAAFGAGVICALWAVGARNSAARDQSGVRVDSSADRASAPRVLLDKPDGASDDLTQIIGIDDPTAKKLNDLGVFHLRQIASWDNGEARWVEMRLNAPGRILRERWTEQAASIA